MPASQIAERSAREKKANDTYAKQRRRCIPKGIGSQEPARAPYEPGPDGEEDIDFQDMQDSIDVLTKERYQTKLRSERLQREYDRLKEENETFHKNKSAYERSFQEMETEIQRLQHERADFERLRNISRMNAKSFERRIRV